MLSLKVGEHVGGLTRGMRRMSWGGESPGIWPFRVKVKGCTHSSQRFTEKMGYRQNLIPV